MIERKFAMRAQDMLAHIHPDNKLEQDILTVAKQTNEAATVSGITAAAASVLAVTNRIQDSDAIVVAGASTDVSQILLQAAGTPREKIFSLPLHVHRALFKQGLFKTEAGIRANRKILEETLKRKEIIPANQNGIRLTVADEYMNSGLKAANALQQLTDMPGIADARFAAFAANPAELERVKRFFALYNLDFSALVLPQQQDQGAFSLVQNLAKLASLLHPITQSGDYAGLTSSQQLTELATATSQFHLGQLVEHITVLRGTKKTPDIHYVKPI